MTDQALAGIIVCLDAATICALALAVAADNRDDDWLPAAICGALIGGVLFPTIFGIGWATIWAVGVLNT